MAVTHQGRQNTPPTRELLTPRSAESNRSSNGSSKYGTSPSSSAKTNVTTPPRSPHSSYGREILPKIRKQDQALESVHPALPRKHPESYTSSGFPMGYNHMPGWPLNYRRSDSPAELGIVTPVSTSSTFSGGWHRYTPPPNSLDVPQPHIPHSCPATTSVAPNEHCSILKYTSSEPTYRDPYSSTAQAHSTSSYSSHTQRSDSTAKTMPTLAVPQTPSVTQPAQPLSPELDFNSYAEAPPGKNLRDYLTESHPPSSLVQRTPSPNRLHDMHFWWDIRNIRPWTEFTLETVLAIPDLGRLLDFDLPEPALPTPTRSSTHPQTLSALHDIHTAYYVVKVNAALKASLGPNTLTMTSAKTPTQPGAVTVPDFLANHAYENEAMPSGGDRARGRVVGLVRAYEQWNSGMRAESATSKIAYLRELAQLHRHMREHGCRYGFIITEIELVCVRMGHEPGVPVFGLLELAAPIQLSTCGRAALTAPLALWYLHMLATNSPLPGQCGWKVDVGGAAARTRSNITERDAWINLKPEGREKRDAKRNRGWVLPDDPLSRRECGRPKRWTKKMERERREREGLNIAY